ncbi:pimeloyl-ACP methyl ester carboxylesterase [Amorphus suaedae]
MFHRPKDATRRTVLLGCALAALAPAAAGAQDASPAPCDTLTAEAIGTDNLAITSVEHVEGMEEAAVPHCILRGALDQRTGADGKSFAIGFEMRLPDTWNGRFFHQANGGADGVVVPAVGKLLGGGTADNALSHHYAVLSSDAGHDAKGFPERGLAGGSAFGLDAQARLDYGYQSTPKLYALAVNVLNARYGEPPAYSYMVGCSNGGRHGMVAAERTPDLYDGILAGAPGFNLPKAALKGPNDIQAAERNGLELRSAFSRDDMRLVGEKVRAACDALDGAEDGIIGDLRQCQATFDPATLACGAEGGSGCLTKAQTTALQGFLAGPTTSDGRSLYAAFPWDTGLGGENWRLWRLESKVKPWDNYPLTTTLGGASLAMIFTTPPTEVDGTPEALRAFQSGFDLDTDAEKIFATTDAFPVSPMAFMTPPHADDPDLADFRASGGKMILFHGVSDPTFSINDTIAWYEKLDANTGGDAASVARLYPIPGMTHCSGGPSTDDISLFRDLVDWVENDEAPASPVATVRADNLEIPEGWSRTRSRPLCAWPTVARYDGSGDLEDASSFRCE